MRFGMVFVMLLMMMLVPAAAGIIVMVVLVPAVAGIIVVMMLVPTVAGIIVVMMLMPAAADIIVVMIVPLPAITSNRVGVFYIIFGIFCMRVGVWSAFGCRCNSARIFECHKDGLLIYI